ncbi:MAG TPA: TrkA family potassium uptake protein [Spirochaetes bacterium]|nr:TrkA family potassium uptake protein [Spirochaetota bacterium]
MMKGRYIVIVGCGRLGSLLANRLSIQGANVVVVDRDTASFENLSVGFSGFQVQGDVVEPEVLRRSKLADADVLLAVTDDDNINLMVAQMAKKIHRVPRVIARIYDPEREELFHNLEIETLCPTRMAAERFFVLLELEIS